MGRIGSHNPVFIEIIHRSVGPVTLTGAAPMWVPLEVKYAYSHRKKGR